MKAQPRVSVERASTVKHALAAVTLALSSLILEACGAHRAAPTPASPDAASFYDYTSQRVRSLAEFEQLAALASSTDAGSALAGVKFVISGFSDPASRRIHFLDGRYYRFHDEWAWFRLLNGQAVPGMAPLDRHPFASPEDARRWARAHEDELPDGLELTDGRLYARSFYDLTLEPRARVLGAGSLVHVAARAPRPEVWAFEIDYTDPAHLPELLVFFEELSRSIPDAARAQLKWIARSPEQLEVGRQLMAEHPELCGRVMTYADVSIPGETAVYTSGIVAGRLRVFRDLSRLVEAEPEDILLLGALPEYLPQARGLVTAIPQTPLAHLNLLAKSRQIVNAYRGGVLDDPDVLDLARSRAPVALSAEGGRLRFQRLTEQQYGAWLASVRPEPPSVAPVDVADVPYVVDLSTVRPADLPQLSQVIGGKNVGIVHLLAGLGPDTPLHGRGTLHADVPDRPLAITIRAYREHLAQLLPELTALLKDDSFSKFKKLRYLALEGAKDFVKKFPSKKDRELAKSYENPRALGPIAALVRKGGVRYLVRHAPLPASFEAELGATLQRHFATYSPDQGLRFRSSSTVEDIEGFNGAGLYDSSTGYLAPRQVRGGEAKRPSVADAVRKTWASYFSFEAFEERHQNRIDHLAADMAVLVHARFDDEAELSNGVFTFSLSPTGRELSLDAQPGSVSVTNPPTDRVVIPESSQVTRVGGRLHVTRKSLSSLLRAGQVVLSDAELVEVYELAEKLTEQHLAQDNAGVAPAQQRRSLVMDFEFRRVRAGWPALRAGQKPSRFVVKQARPLEPSPRVSAELRAAPVPHDVLARARRIEVCECRGAGIELSALGVLTGSDALPDLGYAERPLLASLRVTFGQAAPRTYTHLDLHGARVSPGELRARFAPGSPLVELVVEGGIAHLTEAGGRRTEVPVTCSDELRFAEPRELLRSFVKAR